MPKMKTHRASAKRFRVTGTGKIKRWKSGHRHILTSKSRKRKNRLAKADTVHEADAPKVMSCLPYKR